MAEEGIVIVGAGPAGMRAAITLAEAGRRPIVLDEAARSGGQIYRRPPAALKRPLRALYGFEASRAAALHAAFDALGARIDYRPDTLVWNADATRLHLSAGGRSRTQPWRRLILATGAMDRILPVPGWTTPGVYSLGGAQVALKAQAVAVGRRVVFFGASPLLYLVAHQYASAGIEVAAVLDTTPLATVARAVPGLMRGGRTFLKGLIYVAALRARGVRLDRGATPLEIQAGADGAVAGVSYRDAAGKLRWVACDAVGFGYGLKAEAQLADLLGLDFGFDEQHRQWLPVEHGQGCSSLPGIYLAGDGARIRGADIAELAGERAALALLADDGEPGLDGRIATLERAIGRLAPFRRALDAGAFPFPAHIASDIPDEVMVCRCEGITAGQLRETVQRTGESEINRVKAFTRLGMGRCQGRVCGTAAAEILAEATGIPVASVGRLRGQAPVKPLPLSVFTEAAP